MILLKLYIQIWCHSRDIVTTRDAWMFSRRIGIRGLSTCFKYTSHDLVFLFFILAIYEAMVVFLCYKHKRGIDTLDIFIRSCNKHKTNCEMKAFSAGLSLRLIDVSILIV